MYITITTQGSHSSKLKHEDVYCPCCLGAGKLVVVGEEHDIGSGKAYKAACPLCTGAGGFPKHSAVGKAFKAYWKERKAIRRRRDAVQILYKVVEANPNFTTDDKQTLMGMIKELEETMDI